MKYPEHTTSKPLSEKESKRVLKAVKGGKAITNEHTKSVRKGVLRELELMRSKR